MNMNRTWVFRNLKTHLPFWLTNFLNTTNSSSEKLLMLNLQDISRLLSICGREGFRNLGSSIHTTLIKNPQISNFSDQRTALVTWNSLLFMYSRCGSVEDAAKLFDEMTVKDAISWNTIISCFLRNKDFYDVGFGYFKKMYDSGIYRFDQGTVTTVLSACDSMSFMNKVIHALVCLHGYEREITVGNALITSYFSSGCFGSARRAFEEMNHRNVITWTAMISGYAQNHICEESLKLFMRMRSGAVHPNSLTYLSSLLACSGSQAFSEGCQIHGLVLKSGIHSDLCIESALMDMYSKCGSMREAWQIFESAQVLDEVSMTVILVGFAQNKCEEEAIHVFVRMVKEGIEIDPNMVSAILGVFGFDTSLSLGKQIHSLVIKKSFGPNPFVSNGLINMYSKCGELEESVKVFDEMPERNAVSWNSMIAAFARHGNVGEALQLYAEMIIGGVEPTDVTFLSLLHACSHVGLVDKGIEILQSMEEIHAISPRTEHYSCVIDMLGRAGLLDEAKNFIEGLPDSVQLWQALLGACTIHGNIEVGIYAANKLSLAAPDSPVPYILMANIYSSKGRWKQRAETIKRMKEVGVAKETGISWIEIDKQVHSFVVDDRLHPNIDGINGVLLVLYRHLKDEGYVPDMRFILRYSGQS